MYIIYHCEIIPFHLDPKFRSIFLLGCGGLKSAVCSQKRFSALGGEACSQVAVRLEGCCVDAEAALAKLVRGGDPSVAAALECVIITALTGLNKRFLIIEAAAGGMSPNHCLNLTAHQQPQI